MKILHIVGLNERNTYNLFKQLYEKYDLNSHRFFVMSTKDKLKDFPKFEQFEEFVYLPNNKILKVIKIYKELKRCDFLIFNSLIFNSPKYLVIYYFLRRLYKGKVAWIEWGGDLYNWERANRGLKNRVINYINIRLRKNMTIVGVTSECDVEEVKKQCPNCKYIVETPLPFGTDRFDLLNKIKEKKRRSDSCIFVQVSHNSLQVNNHISTLTRLEKYKYKNIRIVLPLNYGVFGIGGLYGGSEYRNAVIAIANSFFYSKVSVIRKMMNIESYLEYLWNTDILIFESLRPIGMANILYALFLEKKIYISSDSVQYDFLKKKGLEIYDAKNIQNMTWEEFSQPNKEKNSQNEWLINKFYPYKDIEKWQKLFEIVVNLIKKK